MKKILLSFILLSLFSFNILFCQTKDEAVGIKLKGFVKTDIFFDSRQNETYREGHFLLWPKAVALDKNNKDINAKPNFNILSVQTRISGDIKGPEFADTKTSGYIEGEFFGTSEGDVNGFRLRHAYLDFDWKKTKIRVGQYWHQLFITDCYPEVLSFNTGAPFQPFIRSPQVTIIYSTGNLKLTASASSQRDFRSSGPDGISSSYLRNSAIPDIFLGIKAKINNNIYGLSADYKVLVPKLENILGIKTNAKIASYVFQAYSKINIEPLTIKFESILGQNTSHLTMIGGYALKSGCDATGVDNWTNYNIFSFWSEIIAGKDLEYGIFAGFTKNLGTDAILSSQNTLIAYGIVNIDNIYRVSPRIKWKFDNVHIGSEIEFTSAAIGSNDAKGNVIKAKTVSNIRALIACFIFF